MYIPRNISETFLTFVLLPQEKIWKIELIFMFSEFQKKKEILNIIFSSFVDVKQDKIWYKRTSNPKGILKIVKIHNNPKSKLIEKSSYHFRPAEDDENFFPK